MAMPILSRLDRLDRLLQFFEEKQGLSSTPINDGNPKNIENYKTISSALEEVHRKGTLMERLDILEDRVLKLSIFMDMNNNISNSSLTPTFEDYDTSVESSITNLEEVNNLIEPVNVNGYEVTRPTRKGRNGKRKVDGGWRRRYFHMGC